MPEIFHYPAAHIATNICRNYPVTEALVITTDLVARHGELAVTRSAHSRRDYRLRVEHVSLSVRKCVFRAFVVLVRFVKALYLNRTTELRNVA